MKLNEKLSMVIPFYNERDEPYAYAYLQPISVPVFEANFRVLNRTFQSVLSEGKSAARLSVLYLKEAAAQIGGNEHTADELCGPLLAEINRLAVVVVPGASGYDTLPLEQAASQERVDAEDAKDAISAAVFFTAAWHVPPRATRRDLIDAVSSLWTASMWSSDITAWIASLPILNATANTGATNAPTSGGIQITGAG